MKMLVRMRLLGMLALALAAPSIVQAQTTAAERFKALTDPEGLDKALDKAAKDKIRPPYEFFRSQVAPFDVLPYIKKNHWNTLSLELRANMGPYDGYLQTAPLRLPDMPHAVAYRRDARLLQDQTARLSQQLMFPQYVKEFGVELTRPDAIRPDALWSALLLELQPHQMLVQILSKDPNLYTSWTKLHAVLPSSGEKDPNSLDKQRYYRPVISQTPEKPVLSSHPLTWTAMSHVIWDDFSPETLSSGQQQAMLDWLHWGGQLVIVTSVGSSLAPLQDSFLAPYLPAAQTGKNLALQGDALEPLSQAFRPPLWPGEWQEILETNGVQQNRADPPPRYKRAIPIRPALNRPVILTGLNPLPGATALRIDKPDSPILGVERRVGRGRLLITSFRPTDPGLVAWEGYDSLIRRVVLRRPEEIWGETERKQLGNRFLSGPELSWFRLLGRDLGASPPQLPADQQPTSIEIAVPQQPVAAWLDTGAESLPVAARKALEVASGISIPPHRFVLRVMIAYVIALVPLNWLVCRYLLKRRELAWAIVPVLALGFSIGVERLAAHDLGYDSACDEIDLVELQGGYPRAHLNRFVALYSTGRVQATISYPTDPTALALPMNMQRSLPGEEVVQSVFQSSPEPALIGFPVQPRSLAMYRAEQLTPLRGPVQLVTEGSTRQVVNGSELELRDAFLVDLNRNLRVSLGTIAPGATIPVPSGGWAEKSEGKTKKIDWIDLEPFLERLRTYRWEGPEDRGELRLVAWADGPHPGQRLDPKVDRHRGFRLVVAHLEFGAPPNPADPPYFRAPTAVEERHVEEYEINKKNKTP